MDQKRGRNLVVVDHDGLMLEKFAGTPVETVEKDAIDFLLEHPPEGKAWVVPAVPVHVAYAWLSRKLALEGEVMRVPVAKEVDDLVPNPIRDGRGSLYCSVATFRCPDNCFEPVETCTVTGEPRRIDLFDLLGKISVPGYTVRVVRSHQLAPGVGGYRFSSLRQLLEEVRTFEHSVLIATACRCHGVVDGFRFRRTTPSAERRAQSA
jgi:hypothetical protein